MGLGSLENHVKKTTNQQQPSLFRGGTWNYLAGSCCPQVFALPFGVLLVWCLTFLSFLHLTADTLHACQSCRKLFVLCEIARAKRVFRRLIFCSYILRFNESEQRTSIQSTPMECKIFIANNRDCLLMVTMWTHQHIHIMGIGQGKGQVIVQCDIHPILQIKRRQLLDMI